jgi:hypothetical protein
MDVAIEFAIGILALIAFLVWYYFNQHTPSGKRVNRTFALLFGGLLVYGVGLGLDENGYVPHSKETSISAESTWLVGENKTCISAPSGKDSDVTQLVECDKGEQHRIAVTFWGRTEREDAKTRFVTWKCVKKVDSFVCYARN